ncbi:MAG: bacterio-opsin activator domain-containing protein [Haloplanus sp.]
MYPASAAPNDADAERITELEFEITDPTYFFVGLSNDQTCRVRLEEVIRLADGTLTEFFSATDCPRGAIYARANRTEAIDSVRISAEMPDEVVFRVGLSGRCLVETIEGEGAIVQSVIAADGSGKAVAQVPGCIDAGSVVDSVLDHHPTSELAARRNRNVSTPVFTSKGLQQSVQERLTDRQWEVLRTAWEQGYFQRPREHTGAEIAEMLGISSATFSQHLRAAQRHLFSVLVEGDPTFDDVRP